jgi:hypothetical protein
VRGNQHAEHEARGHPYLCEQEQSGLGDPTREQERPRRLGDERVRARALCQESRVAFPVDEDERHGAGPVPAARRGPPAQEDAKQLHIAAQQERHAYDRGYDHDPPGISEDAEPPRVARQRERREEREREHGRARAERGDHLPEITAQSSEPRGRPGEERLGGLAAILAHGFTPE